jgi:hypothetical protein
MVARTFIVYFATNHNIAVIILTQHACVSFSPFCPLTFFRDTTLVTVVTLQVTLVTLIDSFWGNDTLCAVHKEDGTDQLRLPTKMTFSVQSCIPGLISAIVQVTQVICQA